MSLAFGALLLLLLLLPGFILVYTYSRGFWSWTSPASFQRTTDQVALSLVGALVLHLLWSSLARLLFGVQVDVGVVRRLKLDRRTRVLRFKTEWYYLLS